MGAYSHFLDLRSRTHFQQYRGRQISISCFARPDSFSAVPRASGPVFMFFMPGLVFGGIEGVGSRFHVLLFRTHLSWYRGRRSRFHVLISRTHFRSPFPRYRGRRAPFSYFALSNSFSAVPRASGLVFMFCAPGYVFGGAEGVESSFRVLRSRSRFRRL
jgi:hypothetical protein